MKKPKFQVGDRVLVYGREMDVQGERGTVIDIGIQYGKQIRLYLKMDETGSAETTAHPKQCRKLVKRNPRREVLIHESCIRNMISPGGIYDSLGADKYVRFVEAKKK